MTAIPLTEQALAVTRASGHLREHVENLRRQVAQGHRRQAELDQAERWLPDLEAAAATMIRVAIAFPRGEA